MSDAKVYIGGSVFLYREKAPFVTSGVSIFGALEFDERHDKVRCHECGEWFDHLSGHVYKKHGLDAHEYKLKHGLNLTSALCNERIRQRLIAHGKTSVIREASALGLSRIAGPSMGARVGLRAELRNRNGSCKAQLLDRIRCLGKTLGRAPCRRELIRNGIYPQSVEFVFGQSISEVIGLAGFADYGIRGRFARTLSDGVLVEMLRDFYVRFRRPPSCSDFKRKLLPSRSAFNRAFGSMAGAYVAAGLGMAVAEAHTTARRDHSTIYRHEQLLGLIARFISDNGRRPTPEEFSSPKLPPSYKTVRRRLGSLRNAYAGVEAKLGQSSKY